VLAILSLAVYFLFFHNITVHPAVEKKQMQALALTKQQYPLDTFKSDGCSGNISTGWRKAITELSNLSPSVADNYSNMQTIPFESACIAHDQVYHEGDGGYVARLEADNALRAAIINYAIEHTAEIQSRTGIQLPEEVIFLYEIIAETVYRGVRLGGAPCTGMPYAWGFGYNQGNCVPL